MHRAKILASPAYIALVLLAHGLIGQGAPASLPALLMKSGTPVHLELAQTISSAHAHTSDCLVFLVVKDVVIDGFTVIRTGALAKGSVVGVKGKRPLGIGGGVTVRLDSVICEAMHSVSEDKILTIHSVVAACSSNLFACSTPSSTRNTPSASACNSSSPG